VFRTSWLNPPTNSSCLKRLGHSAARCARVCRFTFNSTWRHAFYGMVPHTSHNMWFYGRPSTFQRFTFLTRTTKIALVENLSVIISRRYCDHTSLLVGWFVRYARCNLSKTTSLVFMKFGTICSTAVANSTVNCWDVTVKVQGLRTAVLRTFPSQ